MLVFFENSEQHYHHVQFILERLSNNSSYGKLEKCTFDQATIDFLDLMISSEGIQMDQQKVEFHLQLEGILDSLRTSVLLQLYECL